jgi:4-hydroxy-2-oxoheptanedioate aldolase
MLIVHIETIQAVEAVDEYVAIEDVDVYFLGPTDLSHSLGHPGEAGHPEVVEAMERVAAAVIPSDKALGIYAGNADFAAAWVERGARYIATGTDGFLRQGMREYLNEVRG